MPKSQLFTAAQLKALVVYLAVAFAAILAIGAVTPPGRSRVVFVIGWMVVFPIGVWMVLRAAKA